MQPDVNDYVILANQKGKHFLARILSKESEVATAVICDKNQKKKDYSTNVDFNIADIVSNLGKKPKFGSSYGVQIEYVRRFIRDKEPWEGLYIYRKLSDEDEERLFKTLSRTTKKMLKLNIFPKEKGIELHIKEKKGMWAGHYTRFNNEKNNDVLTLRPSDFIEVDHTIYHETAHGMWYQNLSSTWKSRWIKLFSKQVTLIKDIEKTIKQLRKDLVVSGSVSSLKSDLAEEDKEILNLIIKWVDDTYSIKIKHLDILIEQDDDLSDIWPTDALVLPHKEVLIREYSLTDPEEFFCDAIAGYLVDQKLPKSINSLVEKTISFIASENT